MTSTRALLALALAACSRTADGPIPLDKLEHMYERYLCTSMVRCGLFDDEPLCELLHPSQGYYDNLFTDVDVQAAMAGKIEYDPVAAGKCLTGFFSTCVRDLYAQPRGMPEDCDFMFIAPGINGDACSANGECMSRYCLLLGPCDQNNCCQGVCTDDPTPPSRPTLGESCADNPECIDSFCLAPAMLCAPYFHYGSSCDSTPQCEPGLYCSNGVCLERAGTGDPCTQDADCQYAGDFCNGVECQHRGLAGAPCMSTTDCAYDYICMPPGNTCRLGARIGDPCDFVSYCIDGSTCDPNTMRCVPLKPDGEVCTSAFDCAGHSCVFGVCQTTPACF